MTIVKKTPEQLDRGDKIQLNSAKWTVDCVKKEDPNELRPGEWFGVYLLPVVNPELGSSFIAPSDYEFEVEETREDGELADLEHRRSILPKSFRSFGHLLTKVDGETPKQEENELNFLRKVGRAKRPDGSLDPSKVNAAVDEYKDGEIDVATPH